MGSRRAKDHKLTDREREGLRNSLPCVVTLGAAGVFAFLSGGYILGRTSPVAIVYLLIAAVWVWLLRRPVRPPLLFLLGLGAFGLFVAWSGLSVLWSIGPDLSWEAFNLAAFYLAVVLLLAFTPARLLQLRVAAAGYLVVAGAVGLYAYAGRVVPDLVRHALTEIRLADPVGYYNVLALLMVLGLAVALALAGDRSTRPWWRVLAAAAAVPLALTFFFAFSRGGWIAFAVVLAVYFALSATRLASLATLAAIAAPVALVLYLLRDLTTVFANVKDAALALRVEQGHTLLVWSLAALVVTAALQGLIVLVQQRVPLPRRARVAVGAAVAAIVLVGLVGGSGYFIQSQGGTNWVRERASAFVSDSDTTIGGDRAGRLLSVNTGRLPSWRAALAQSEVSRLTGTGSGTFPFTWYRFRVGGGIVKHSHSEYLDVLSEVGVVGLALFAATVVLLVAGAIGNPWKYRADPGRSLLAALQAGSVGFFVHIAVDWDWDMAAIGTVIFLFLGACGAYLGTRRRPEEEDVWEPHYRRWGRPLRVGLSATLVLLAASWALPYVSGRAHDAAIAASAEGQPAAALVQAERSARYNPLAAEPLIVQAQLLQQLGRNREALAVLQSAERLQPDNFRVYEELGLLWLTVFARRDEALGAFAAALALNPVDGELKSEYEQAAASR
jgi:O-antigen ligase